MPRKAFVNDLQEAKATKIVANVYEIKAGDDDGTFTFLYKAPGGDVPAVTVQAHISGE